MVQTSLDRTCMCSDSIVWSRGDVTNISVSYNVPAGHDCCSGSAYGGTFGESWVSNTGQTLMVDACPTLGSIAQSYCC